MLGSIGGLIAATVRGAPSIDQRQTLVSTVRTLWSGLPNRDSLQVGTQRGAVSNSLWRLDVAPWRAGAGQRFDEVPRQARPSWMPVVITVTVQGSSGRSFQL